MHFTFSRRRVVHARSRFAGSTIPEEKCYYLITIAIKSQNVAKATPFWTILSFETSNSTFLLRLRQALHHSDSQS